MMAEQGCRQSCLLVKLAAEVSQLSEPMRAEVADPAERARLWSPLVAMYPTYDDYQAKTERQIPVVVFTPHEPTS